MPVSVTMPRLGESVTEGTVTRWLKQEGDRVEVDEPLLEVSTDKVDTEIPSPAAGVLARIVVAEDETAEVGAGRIRRALEVVPPERLVVAPDCGMKYLPRELARRKLEAMVAGARLVREDLGG